MYDYGWKQLDLEGTTLGILAFGNIGRAVAKRAQGFSMKVYAVDKFPSDPPSTPRRYGASTSSTTSSPFPTGWWSPRRSPTRREA